MALLYALVAGVLPNLLLLQSIMDLAAQLVGDALLQLAPFLFEIPH